MGTELGELRHRIRFFLPATRTNSNGVTTRDPGGTPVSQGYARCRVINRGMGERNEGQQTTAVKETLFRMRAPKDFTPTAMMYLEHKSQKYYITRIEDWNDGQLMDVWAERRDYQG